MTVAMTDCAARDRRAETLYRSMTLDRSAADLEARSVPASLSSEIEVARWFGREVLMHTPEAVDLARAAEGLPLLWNHNSDQPIGLVENVRLDGNKLRGTLRFSRNAKAEEVWRDVQDGMLRNISIGYQIRDWVEAKDSDLVTVSRWSLLEASIVPVPADPTVGIGRAYPDVAPSATPNREVVRMTEKDPAPVATPATPEPVTTPVIDLSAIRREHEIVAAAARREAIEAERRRVADVGNVFESSLFRKDDPQFAALRAKALADGWSVDQTRAVVLQALETSSQPVADKRVSDEARGLPHPDKPVSDSRIQGGVDALDKFKDGMATALAIRARLVTDKDSIHKAREGGFLGVRLSRLAERYLNYLGVDTRAMDDELLAKRAVMYRGMGMTTSDFANVLSNTANKALMLGWEQAPETWQQWVRIGSVPDFKQAERTGLSGFTSLARVPEDGEITYGKFTDRKEVIQAVSYAKKFRLTYQAIKNDDLNAFTAIPRGMGRAAQSVIGDIVYGKLDGVGPTLNQDSIALWDTSTHKNYVAAATAPTVATLNTANAAMKKQKDPNNSKVLNITPKFLIVPVALEATARELLASEYAPDSSPGSTSGKNTMTRNIWYGNTLQIIADPRLDDQTNGLAAWYLAADPNVFDTVEVAFVDGVAEPYLREEQEWDTRGVEWVVGVDFGVAVLDYRAMHKYKGNT